MPKLVGCSKGSSKREVHSNECLPQKGRKKRKVSNKQPNFIHLKKLEKEEET